MANSGTVPAEKSTVRTGAALAITMCNTRSGKALGSLFVFADPALGGFWREADSFSGFGMIPEIPS
jgi:hypothetical protein